MRPLTCADTLNARAWSVTEAAVLPENIAVLPKQAPDSSPSNTRKGDSSPDPVVAHAWDQHDVLGFGLGSLLVLKGSHVCRSGFGPKQSCPTKSQCGGAVGHDKMAEIRGPLHTGEQGHEVAAKHAHFDFSCTPV